MPIQDSVYLTFDWVDVIGDGAWHVFILFFVCLFFWAADFQVICFVFFKFRLVFFCFKHNRYKILTVFIINI